MSGMPMAERGILHVPGRASLRRLVDANGEPPWTLHADCMIAPELMALVGFVEMGGELFVKVDALEPSGAAR